MRKLDPKDPEDILTIRTICDNEDIPFSKDNVELFEIKISLFEKLFLNQLVNVEDFINVPGF